MHAILYDTKNSKKIECVKLLVLPICTFLLATVWFRLYIGLLTVIGQQTWMIEAIDYPLSVFDGNVNVANISNNAVGNHVFVF